MAEKSHYIVLLTFEDHFRQPIYTPQWKWWFLSIVVMLDGNQDKKINKKLSNEKETYIFKIIKCEYLIQILHNIFYLPKEKHLLL